MKAVRNYSRNISNQHEVRLKNIGVFFIPKMICKTRKLYAIASSQQVCSRVPFRAPSMEQLCSGKQTYKSELFCAVKI